MASTAIRTTALAALATGAVGTVTLFLPFAYHTSPMQGLRRDDWFAIWKLALPFFLAPLLLYTGVRLFVAGAVSGVERRIIILLSAVTFLVTASIYFVPKNSGSWPSGPQEWMSSIMPLGILLVEALWLWRLRRRTSPSLFALAAIVCAYLLNAGLCSIAFAQDWQRGAYVTMATVIGCVLTAGFAWQTRHSSSAEGARLERQ